MYQLISNVQLMGSKIFDSQILIHSFTENNDVSMAQQLQNICLRSIRKHEVIDQGKYRKIPSKRKWIDREYHVQDHADVAQKNVKIFCDTKQFSELAFCGPHPKPHG